jgi:DNA-binding NarL/FixJ family response regulator
MNAATGELRYGDRRVAGRSLIAGRGGILSEQDTILLIGNRPLLLEATERLLARRGFAVGGQANSARRGIRLLLKEGADAVVVDAHLGEDELRTILGRLRTEGSTVPVVVLGDSPEDPRVRFAFDEGAAAVVVASAHPDDLVTAIRQVIQRSVFLPSEVAREVTETKTAEWLTEREREVLRLVADGLSNAEAARRLWVTEQTVKFHLSNIYRKLGVSNRTEASRYARLHRLLD